VTENDFIGLIFLLDIWHGRIHLDTLLVKIEGRRQSSMSHDENIPSNYEMKAKLRKPVSAQKNELKSRPDLETSNCRQITSNQKFTVS